MCTGSSELVQWVDCTKLECYNQLMATKKQKELEFKTIIEQDEDGYFVVSVPELPGCHTQGKTLEEARKRIKEATNLYLDTHPELKKEKIKTPYSWLNFFAIENMRINYA